MLASASVADDALTLLTVDAEVHGVQKVTRVEDIRLTGRGGTDMSVGIMAALETKPRPDIIVVLTDGYTPWPPQRLPVPVIAGLICRGYTLSARDRPPPWIRSVDIDD
jgi:predicted metal-dependent peptidase